jgi:hypothetical protein
MRWEGLVARMDKMRNIYKDLVRKPEGISAHLGRTVV